MHKCPHATVHEKVTSTPNDISWLFASAPDMLVSYGKPSANAISVSRVQSSQILSTACATTPRPNLAIYAPAYTGQYQFPIILQVWAVV